MVLMKRLRAVWLRLVVHVAALVPLLLLALAYIRGRLGFDPVREITLRTGRYGMVLLILSLACTPVAVVMGFKRVLRVRRAPVSYTHLRAHET